MANGIKGFFFKYRRYIVVSIAIYIFLTVLLILSSGGDLVPFVYQVF